MFSKMYVYMMTLVVIIEASGFDLHKIPNAASVEDMNQSAMNNYQDLRTFQIQENTSLIMLLGTLHELQGEGYAHYEIFPSHYMVMNIIRSFLTIDTINKFQSFCLLNSLNCLQDELHNIFTTKLIHTVGKKAKVLLIASESCARTNIQQSVLFVKERVAGISCFWIGSSRYTFSSTIQTIKWLLRDPYTDILFLMPTPQFVNLFENLHFNFQGRSLVIHDISKRFLTRIVNRHSGDYNYIFKSIDLIEMTEMVNVLKNRLYSNGNSTEARIVYQRNNTTNTQYQFQLPPYRGINHYHRKRKHIRVTTVLNFPPSCMLVPFTLRNNRCISSYPCRIPTKENNEVVGWERSCCDGHSLVILDAIAKKLEFTYDIYITPDGFFGGLVENGSWNGMVNQVYTNQADLAVHSITVSPERFTAVDFTTGFETTNMIFITKAKFKGLPFVNWEFLNPLEPSVVHGILITTVMSMISISLTENIIGYFVRRKSNFSLREVMTYVLGLAFQRDMGGRNPLRWPGRVAAIGYAAGMTIVMTTYTAHIAATNIKVKVHDDFKGLQDDRIRFPTSGFKFTALESTASELFFKDDDTGKYQNTWQFMQTYRVKSDAMGIEKVFTGELDAYITDYKAAGPILTQKRYCNSMIMHEEDIEKDLAFAYQKGNSFGKEISTVLLELRETGIVAAILKRWLYSPRCVPEGNIEQRRFEWTYFGGIVSFMGWTLLVSIAIVLLENLYTKIKFSRTTFSSYDFNIINTHAEISNVKV